MECKRRTPDWESATPSDVSLSGLIGFRSDVSQEQTLQGPSKLGGGSLQLMLY